MCNDGTGRPTSVDLRSAKLDLHLCPACRDALAADDVATVNVADGNRRRASRSACE